MKRLLVTGFMGFVGSTVLKTLANSGEALGYRLCMDEHEFELRDPAAVSAAIATHRPEAVLHLAAQAQVSQSLIDPAETLHVNAVGTANLLRALSDHGFGGRVLFVSSADVYGAVPESELPVSEGRAVSPLSPYAISKLAAEMLCLQWASMHGFEALIARSFNHTGAGQRPEFALSGFARDAVSIRKGLVPPLLSVGDLSVTRDWLDVEDVADAYLRLLDRGVAGEIYNVCSGDETSLGDALGMILDIAGVQPEIVEDPLRMRPMEQRRMRGDYSKLAAATGWAPSRNLHQTLSNMIHYWDKELDGCQRTH